MQQGLLIVGDDQGSLFALGANGEIEWQTGSPDGTGKVVCIIILIYTCAISGCQCSDLVYTQFQEMHEDFSNPLWVAVTNTLNLEEIVPS